MKFVLKLLMMEQKQHHLEMLQNMLGYANSDPDFLNTIISGEMKYGFMSTIR